MLVNVGSELSLGILSASLAFIILRDSPKNSTGAAPSAPGLNCPCPVTSGKLAFLLAAVVDAARGDATPIEHPDMEWAAVAFAIAMPLILATEETEEPVKIAASVLAGLGIAWFGTAFWRRVGSPSSRGSMAPN